MWKPKEVLKTKILENYETFLRIIIAILFIMLPLQLNLSSIENGLNKSWVYAENLLVNNKLYYGRDIVWPWGPLGFVFHVVNIENNLKIAVIFWGLLYTLWAVLVFLTVMDKDVPKIDLIAAMVFLFLSEIQPEYFLFYVFMLAMIHLWNGKKWAGYVALGLFIIMFYVKFTLSMMAIGTLFMYLIVTFYTDRSSFRYMVRNCIIAMIILPLSWLCYDRKLEDFGNYIKYGLNISSGYNSALSLNYYDSWWIFAVIMVILYLVLLFLELRNGKYWGWLLIFSPAFFMVYKHGFVRADGHIEITLSGVLWILSLFWLVKKKPVYRKKRQKAIFISMVLIIACIPIALKGNFVKSSVEKINQNYRSIMNGIHELVLPTDQSEIMGIPSVFQEIIGDDTATVYGWEISALKDSNINYIPVPTLQMYESYTPELDKKSALLFTGDDAPTYIIFSLETMDNRIPIIEVPETWQAISNNYYACAYVDSNLLLKKKYARNVSNTINYEQSMMVQTDDIIEIDTNYDVISISAEKNVRGKIASLFWKIPAVTAKIEFEDGTSEEGRVILENLSGGIPVKALPSSYGEIIDLLNKPDISSKKVKSISFGGDGIRYYRDFQIKYGYAETTELHEYQCQIMYDVNENTFDDYSKLDEDVYFSMDNCKKENGCIAIQGWAYAENRETDIYFVCGDVIYNTGKKSRQDVLNLFGVSGISADNIGYTCLLPETDTLSVLLVDKKEHVILEKQIW